MRDAREESVNARLAGQCVESGPDYTHIKRRILDGCVESMLYYTHLMRKTWIWEDPTWPSYTYDGSRLLTPMAISTQLYGRLTGLLANASADNKREAEIQALVADAVDTSAIEGEKLDPATVRDSIVRRLSLPGAGIRRADDRTEGVVDVTLDALDYEAPVTHERLFMWHSQLFPIVRNDRPLRNIGQYRDDANGPMTIQTSRGYGRSAIVHYEAPPAERVYDEVSKLLAYINDNQSDDRMIRAGIAHVWFEQIHPFEDGNGRIGRALADLLLSRARGPENRYISLSRQILKEQKEYYAALEGAQTFESQDLTNWLTWFLTCYGHAAESTIAIVDDVLRATKFFAMFSDVTMNERQKKIVQRLLDGFDGKMNAGRYSRMTGVSHDTANRDLHDLVAKGILTREGGSKNTSYQLVSLTSIVSPTAWYTSSGSAR